MNRITIVKFCVFIVLFHEIVGAQDRILLAEGDSVAATKSGAKPLSHWKLWRLNNGEYEVVDTGVRNASVVQTFRFDSQFMPIGYSMKHASLDLQGSRIPKSPGGEISFEYKPKELTCETISGDGTKSTKTVPAIPPYVAVGEFYDLDFIWYMTGVVHLASSGNSDGLVHVYAMTGEKREIGLKPDRPFRISRDGDGTELVLGQMQRIKNYKSENGRTLIGTDRGLIVRISVTSSPGFGYAIENYKEYGPWGVPFGNISNTAAPK
jgi:hypothetical protein